jgi:hypothetical protein
MSTGATYAIRFDGPAATGLGPDGLPTLSYAVKAVAEAVQARWTGYAMGQPLPDGRKISARAAPDYAGSIALRQTGPLSAEVYSDDPAAERIERGTPARDLKRMLETSQKTRRSAKGRRYLIIPFRHGTPGTSSFGRPMPSAVHGWWKAQHAAGAAAGPRAAPVASSVRGMGTRTSATGHTVPQAAYRWGARMDAGALQRLGVSGEHAKRLTGMVNFRSPGKSGGGAQSHYMTFRTMSEDSSGWIVPAKPGYFPARAAVEQVRSAAEQAFARAVEEDIRRALGAR